jgi:hypothetical protein
MTARVSAHTFTGMRDADPNDAGLLTAAETSLLTDQYELAMAASYLRREMNEPAVFELFTRRLPPNRQWLLAAGLGPALRMVQAMRFRRAELDYPPASGSAPTSSTTSKASPSPATSMPCQRAPSRSPTSRCCG